MERIKMNPLPRTKIVTLCGSTKFKEEYLEWQRKLTLDGWIVVSVGFFGHVDNYQFTKEGKDNLDRLHLNKVMIADLIFIIDKEEYIGDSTKREIDFAKKLSKPIVYMTMMHPLGPVKMRHLND